MPGPDVGVMPIAMSWPGGMSAELREGRWYSMLRDTAPALDPAAGGATSGGRCGSLCGDVGEEMCAPVSARKGIVTVSPAAPSNIARKGRLNTHSSTEDA